MTHETSYSEIIAIALYSTALVGAVTLGRPRTMWGWLAIVFMLPLPLLQSMDGLQIIRGGAAEGLQLLIFMAIWPFALGLLLTFAAYPIEPRGFHVASALLLAVYIAFFPLPFLRNSFLSSRGLWWLEVKRSLKSAALDCATGCGNTSADRSLLQACASLNERAQKFYETDAARRAAITEELIGKLDGGDNAERLIIFVLLGQNFKPAPEQIPSLRGAVDSSRCKEAELAAAALSQ